MTKQDKSPAPPKKDRKMRNNMPLSIKTLFDRYHAIAFTVVVISALTVAMFVLNNIVVLSDSESDYTPAEADMRFDDDTVKRLRELTPSTEAPHPVEFPDGRTDPFRQ